MTNEQFIIEIKKRGNLLLLFLLIIFFGFLYLQFNYYNKFTSTCNFTIASSEMIELGTFDPNEPEKFYFDRSGTNRIFSIVYSNDILDHLIKKFDLYTHYNVDSTSALHYENVVETLMSRIAMKKIDFNLVALTATDKDPLMAAAIANEAVDQINVTFRNLYLNKLKKKIVFYENMLKDIHTQDSVQRNYLYSMLNDIRNVTNIISPNADQGKLNDQLRGITDQLKNNSDNISKTYQLYRSAYGALELYDLQTVQVIRKALPEQGKGIFRKVVVSVAVTFFMGCVLLLALYFYLVNKPLLKILFSKN